METNETIEANEKALNSNDDVVNEAALQELQDEPLRVSEESDYHRVSAGCPRAFTQQCGTGYRT